MQQNFSNKLLALQGGDLRHALNWDDADELAWDKRGRGIMLDVARGLHFLHSTGVVHRQVTAMCLQSATGSEHPCWISGC